MDNLFNWTSNKKKFFLNYKLKIMSLPTHNPDSKLKIKNKKSIKFELCIT
jgi:hypothetical protein